MKLTAAKLAAAKSNALSRQTRSRQRFDMIWLTKRQAVSGQESTKPPTPKRNWWQQ